jgi:hypothetical protein
MGIGLVKQQGSLFIQEETVEGTHVDPSSAADAIEVEDDGLSFDSSHDIIERNNLTSTVETVAPRIGLKNVSAEIGIEIKAASVTGSAPPMDRLLKNLLGGKRQNTTTVTSKNTAHTSTKIFIEDADISKFAKGDVVVVLRAGMFEPRPISNLDDTGGAAFIEFPFALKNGAPPNSVLVSKFTTYFADDGWKTLSLDYYAGGEIREKFDGMRPLSMSVDGWETGKLPSAKFKLEGLDSDQSVASAPYTPDFSADAAPPALLEACAYLDGIEIDYNTFKLSIENTKADIPSACQVSGKVGSRITKLKVSGSIDPYKEDDDVNRWDDFEANASTSLFVFAHNPKDPAVDGEFREYVCFWMPNIKVNALKDGDLDGVIQDAIDFQAFKNAGNDTVFVGFI